MKFESLHASYNIHGRFVIDEGWQFRSKVTYLFHCIHDGVTFGERIDRDDVEPAFHDFVSPFTLSRFLDLHSPSLFCTFTSILVTSLANTRIRLHLKIAFESP